MNMNKLIVKTPVLNFANTMSNWNLICYYLHKKTDNRQENIYNEATLIKLTSRLSANLLKLYAL